MTGNTHSCPVILWGKTGTLPPLAVAAALALILVLVAGCGLEAPEAPQFDTQLYVPLEEETYTGEDMARNLEAIEGSGSEPGPLTIHISEEFDPLYIGDRLSLEVRGDSYRAELEYVEFDLPQLDPVTFDLGDLRPGAALPPGQEAVIDAFEFTSPNAELGPFDDFSAMTFAAGSLRLALTNRLPVPVGGSAPGEVIHVYLQNPSTCPPQTLASWEIAEEIAPGSSFDALYDLTNLTIGSQLSVWVSGWSAGSGGAAVLVTEEQGLDLDLALHAAAISSVTGNLPELSFETHSSVQLDDRFAVTHAVIARGVLAWELHNELPTPVHVSLQADHLRRGAQPLRVEAVLPASGSTDLEIDLAGAVIEGAENGTLDWTIAATSEASETPQTVSSGDAVAAVLETASVSFDSVSGVLDHVPVDIAPIEVTLEFPEGTEGIELTVAEAQILLRNRVGVSAVAMLEIWGEAGGDTVRVPFTAQVAPRSEAGPAETLVILNERNSAILDLLTLRSEQVTISGSLEVGDGTSEAQVSADDFLDGTISVIAPMKIVLETAHLEGDSFAIDIDEEIRERISENLLDLTVDAHVENHFPADVQVKLHFARTEGALFVNDDLIRDTDAIALAAVDLESGRVDSATTSRVLMEVASGDIKVFAEEKLYGAVEITLLGDGESPVEIWSTDFVTIKGVVSFSYRVE